MPRTILIMAGGTGGHIFPALAVADALKRAGCEVVWLGTRNGMEAKLVPERGYEIEYIAISGVRKTGILRWLALPLNLFIACLQSVSVLLRRRPDVVLGMGGFASFPGGLAAAGLGKPLVIHEQNAVAGLSNRMLSKIAARTLVAFPGVLGRKALHVGNPVREDISSLPAPEIRFASRTGPIRLFVVGGSRGARALNEAIPQALGMLEEKPLVLHQTGQSDVESVKAAYSAFKMEAEIVPFLGDMAKAYAECDLVVSRSGALTVAEIAAAGVASILVPYPHAVDDHQSVNARYLSDAGAAVLIRQQDLDPGKLGELLKKMDRATLLEMAKKARRLAISDATGKVAGICMELAA